jgi:hypothetical protein
MSEPSNIHSIEKLARQTPLSASGTGTKASRQNLWRILVLITALSIAALGLLGGSIGLFLSMFSHSTDSLSVATLSFSFLVLAVGLGSVLAWHTWHAIRGYPSPNFQPRGVGLLTLLFPLSLVVGNRILVLNLLPIFTFPPFHVAATVLPAWIILALVSLGLGSGTSRRDIVVQISSGAFLGAPLAFVLEGIAILSSLVIALISLAARPGGAELIQGLTTTLQDLTLLQDSSFLTPKLISPTIMALAVAFVAGVVPLVEEGIKTIGVGLRAYRRPAPSEAFLWGLAGGAGFAIVEGLLNTAGGWEAWAPVILLRVGATLLHCFTGALMGIAWYVVLGKRRWIYGLGLYAASVATHGLWNTLSIGMVVLSLGQSAADLSTGSQAKADLGIAVMLVLLVSLSLLMALSLLGLTRHLRRRTLTGKSSEIHPLDPIPSTVLSRDQRRQR